MDLMAHTHRYSASMTSPCDGQLFRWKVRDYPELACACSFSFLFFFMSLCSAVQNHFSRSLVEWLSAAFVAELTRATSRRVPRRSVSVPFPPLRSLHRNASCERGMCRLAARSLRLHSHPHLLAGNFDFKTSTDDEKRRQNKNHRTGTFTWKYQCSL